MGVIQINERTQDLVYLTVKERFANEWHGIKWKKSLAGSPNKQKRAETYSSRVLHLFFVQNFMTYAVLCM